MSRTDLSVTGIDTGAGCVSACANKALAVSRTDLSVTGTETGA